MKKEPLNNENEAPGSEVGALKELLETYEKSVLEQSDKLYEEIAARKRMEGELRVAKEEAEEANRLKSEFLANMSHEIRTPMNGVLGMTELLMDTDTTAEQREYLNAVYSSANALMTIINDILDFSKIEAQKMELDSVGFNLRDSIGDILNTLSLRASVRELELAYHVHPEVPDAVVGDPGRLRQIIVNLVGNAIKFTEKGEVVLDIEPQAGKDDEAFLHFSVSDTGIGIPPEKQKRIFDAFAQVDASTSRRYGGTGLGLTISSRLVELMGGCLWVESELEKGSVFHFTLRLGLQKDPSSQELPENPEDLQDLPVLVVDDNSTNRRILEEMLRSWRMKPATADSGSAALRMITQAEKKGEPFRLMLFDVNMPLMDGFELVERIRQSQDPCGATIMLLTSSGQRGDAARCRELGISAYLTKPVKQSSLLDAIMTVLGMTKTGTGEERLVTRHTLREQMHSLRVLLAEDNAVNRKIAASMLEKRGHRVVVAENGKKAVSSFEGEQEHPFDLILMDIQMPEMDGLEATALIREKEKTLGGHITIIALTAHAMKGDREMCLNAGMDGYVSKPLRADELFSAIEELIPAKSGVEELAVPATHSEGKGAHVFSEEAALSSVDGDRELLREVVQIFIKEYPCVLSEIRSAISEGNAHALNRSAHSLKGLVGNFGADAVYDLALKLEILGKNEEITGAKGVLKMLEEETVRLRQELEAFTGGSTP